MRSVVLVSCLTLLAGCTGTRPEPESPYLAVRGRPLARWWTVARHFAVHSYVIWNDGVRTEAAERVWGGVSWHEKGWNPDHDTYGLVQGEEALAAIERVRAVISSPKHGETYETGYMAWPGPNSNSYTANLCREANLSGDLPPTAVGKDWPDTIDYILGIGLSTTGWGLRLDLFGVLGVQIGLIEGIELHLLGTAVGVALWPPAIKLPIVGRLGF